MKSIKPASCSATQTESDAIPVLSPWESRKRTDRDSRC